MNERDVRTIIEFEPAKRGDIAELAQRFGVNRSVIHGIRAGKTWKHISRS